jgi:hypothetical protein
MRKMFLISAFALLVAACGGSDNDVAVGDATGETSASVENSTVDDSSASSAGSVESSTADDSSTGSVEESDDTISVDDFGDMPPKCIELLATFLKQIEPTVSAIDWDKATLGEFEEFSKQFEAESDSFDSQTAAAGCDKYNLTGSDEQQFEQMAELAAAEAPGALGFITFLRSLSESQTAAAASIPSDCAGTIAAIEPYLARGSMRDLTVGEVGLVGQLMGAVGSNCTAEEASAFYDRDDVAAFTGG